MGKEATMRRKILIAFDDSENAMRAVSYVAETFTKNVRITLFSVLHDTAALCDMNSPELTPYFKSQQHAFCVLEDKQKELVSEAQLKAKALLIENGFGEDQIQIKSESKKKGIARDIANEAQLGYDLIVVGRRGTSGIKEYFLGSISQKILNLAPDASILIVN
jgi:nucleotide-binding universal stress UspA family protein